MSRLLTRNDLTKFIEQLRLTHTVDLPNLANKMGYNYFTQIKPAINNNPWFREEIGKAWEELVFKLQQRVLDVALDGKPKNRPSPEIQYINSITKLIQSGILLDGNSKVEIDLDDLNEHKKRLGIE